MRTLFSMRSLFVLAALFIFYATTIPWDFGRAPSLDRVAWIPLWDLARGRPPSISDLVQNVVLFVPFGFFGALALPFVRRSRPVTGALIVGLLGLALSLLVEALQTMSVERSPSASDLTTNFAGATIGAAIAFVYARHLQDRIEAALAAIVTERPGLLVFLAYTAAVAAGALAPFIPSLDVSDLRANVRQLLDHPWGPKPLGALVSDALLFAGLSFLCASEVPSWLASKKWFPSFGGVVSRVHAAMFAVAAVSIFSLALEFAQLFIIDHSPGFQDAVAGIVGALVGAALVTLVDRGPLRPAAELGELSTRAPALVLAFAVLAPAVRALSPFEFVSPSEKLADFNVWQFVPFWAFFRNVNLATFRNVFEAAMYYAPLGYALFALRHRPPITFVLALVLAEALEIAQIPIAGRTFDITEGIYAGAGALAGAYLLLELRARRTVGKAPIRKR